jgi:hypothetical protein
MFQCIQNLEHAVRTIFGDSTTSFGGDEWDIPCSGIGQGNAAGSHIWVLVSSRLLKMLRNGGIGVVFYFAISGDSLTFLVGYSFVDNSDLTSRPLAPKNEF